MGWLGEIIHMDFPPTVVHCFDHFTMAKCISRQRNWYFFFYIMGGKGGQLEGEAGGKCSSCDVKLFRILIRLNMHRNI
jgi:hypothetical protein